MGFEFELKGLDKLDKQLANLERELLNMAEVSLKAALLPIQNEAKRRAPKRAGDLSRSIHSEITERTATSVTGQVGTNKIYAKIQELGGTITPKKGRFLAIPISNAARAVVGPRNFPGELHFQRTKSGMSFLADESGVAHFWLARSVTIKAKPYLRPAFDDRKKEAIEVFGDVFRKKLQARLKR